MKGIIQQVLENGMEIEYSIPDDIEAFLFGLKRPKGTRLLDLCIVDTPLKLFIYKYDRSRRRKR